MPFLKKREHKKWLEGKTIKKVTINNIASFSLQFTDGSCIDFNSHCTHNCTCKEQIIVNKFDKRILK